MAQGDVTIDLRGDNSDLKQSLNESKGVIGGFASSATSALAIVGSALALAGAATGIVQLRDLYDEQADAEANLARTLENTGHAAGFTIDQLKTYAKQLRDVTNFSDQTILSGQRMLATFENVKGDEFKRVTELALDMAEATGGDAAASMEKLGRALNDPLKGMRVLRAEGVLLTKEQQDQIKAMTEAGDIAGAQGILLDQLATKYGGIAQNAADPWDQFWNTLTDRGEQAFAIIAPLFDAFFGLLKDTLDFIEPIGPAAEESIGSLIELAQETYAEWEPLISWLGEQLTRRFTAVQMLFETLGSVALETFSALSGAVDVDGTAVLDFFKTFFEFANDLFIGALIAMQVGIENWQDVVTTAVLATWLKTLSTYEDWEHYLTVNLPEAVDWFADHWKDVLDDMAVFAGTIFNNLIHNAEQFMAGLAAALKGQSLELDWRDVTEGYQSSVKDLLPEFSERQLTETERALKQQLDEAAGRVRQSWDEKYAELDRRSKDFLAGSEATQQQEEIVAGEGTDYQTPVGKGGGKKGAGGGGSAFEDITSLYDRIAGAAAKVPEIEVTVEMPDELGDEFGELASVTERQTGVLSEMRDLTRKILDKPQGLQA